VSEQYYLKGRGTGPSELFVATTSGSSPKPNYIGSLMATTPELAGMNVDWLLHQGDCHVDDARNACVSLFLKSRAQKLLFIDDDVGWYPDQFVKFIKHDRDVVAGLYPQKKDEPTYPVRLLPPPFQAEPDGLLQVEAVPTGFLMLSRDAVVKMAALSPTFNHDDDKAMPLLFERAILDGRRWSGDFWFSRKWTEAGGSIWIDPEMSLTHCGQKTWEGCFADYLRDHNGIMDPHLDAAFRKLQEGVVRPEVWEVISERSDNPWAAPAALMPYAWEMAKSAKGAVLETGSGLTTVIMGMTGAKVHALEHSLFYYRKTKALLERYGLDNVRLYYAPLREETDWYTVPASLPLSFDLLVCDGPPRLHGDRTALWRQVGDSIKDADWLIDDVDGNAAFYEQNGRKAELIGRFAVVRRT
jgi:hypothetical protein